MGNTISYFIKAKSNVDKWNEFNHEFKSVLTELASDIDVIKFENEYITFNACSGNGYCKDRFIKICSWISETHDNWEGASYDLTDFGSGFKIFSINGVLTKIVIEPEDPYEQVEEQIDGWHSEFITLDEAFSFLEEDEE